MCIYQTIEKGKYDPAEKKQGTSKYIPNLCKYKIYAAPTHLQIVWYSRPYIAKLSVK